MMNFKLLYQWQNEIAKHLGSLNSWQVENVALFSYGLIRAESCQQGSVARQVSCQEKVDSASRRWRRFLDNKRFPLERFFQEWVSWVVEALALKQVMILVDETKLQDRVAVMMVGLAWEGRCIPLVWRAYRANDARAYPEEGQVRMIENLLCILHGALPPEVRVVVLADRGIGTSPDLCRVVAGFGWHYLFRVTCQTKIVTAQTDYTIAQQVQPGDIWAMSGTIFKKRGQIPAYARALWSVGYAEPWALVTNDERLTGHEYARRAWQEQSFRDLKSGGWHWGASRIRHADHVQRLLVLLTLAYALMVALGSQAVSQKRGHALQQHAEGRVSRHYSLFREGLDYFVELCQCHTRCPQLLFIPDQRFT
jgi:hypothetical protein